MANLLKDLAEAIASKGIETPPKGWLTTTEWAADSKYSMRRTFSIIAASVAAGKMERKEFRIRTSAGVVRPVAHYRVKP